MASYQAKVDGAVSAIKLGDRILEVNGVNFFGRSTEVEQLLTTSSSVKLLLQEDPSPLHAQAMHQTHALHGRVKKEGSRIPTFKCARGTIHPLAPFLAANRLCHPPATTLRAWAHALPLPRSPGVHPRISWR